MITWFDALLVTIWAAVTVLGLRRGLAGGLWALLTLPVVLLSNSIPLPSLSVVVAVVLGVVAAWVAQRVFFSVPVRGWHVLVGGVGGFMVGFLIVASIALSLPLRVIGSQGTYPSSALPAPLYYATFNSLFVQGLSGVWSGGPVLKRLLLPDQVR